MVGWECHHGMWGYDVMVCEEWPMVFGGVVSWHVGCDVTVYWVWHHDVAS